MILALLVALLVAGAGDSWADKSPSTSARRCRAGTASSVRLLTRRGLKFFIECVNGRIPGRSANDCGTIDATTETPYGRGEARTTQKLGNVAICATGNPADANFIGGSPSQLIVPTVQPLLQQGAPAVPPTVEPAAAAGSSTNSAGNRCVRAATRARGIVIESVLTRATACQKRLDKHSDQFGPIADVCLVGAGSAAGKAAKLLRRACRADATSVCAPLPGCVVDAAVATGHGLARASYSVDVEQLPNVCGDGHKTGDEQCDDGNTVSGDGCSSTCMQEGCFIDGVVTPGAEQCDDGNTTDDDCCSNECMPAICGDGRVALGCGEQCDDAVDPGCVGCKYPAVACDGRGVVARVRVDYDKVGEHPLAAVKVDLAYSAQVSIPAGEGGFVDASRLVDLTGKGGFIGGSVPNVGTLSVIFALTGIGSAFDPGDVFSVLFDCPSGDSVSVADFGCQVVNASDSIGNDSANPGQIPCSVGQVSLP
jgi:cysteine-rich repeat protein